jgi:chorismate mutase
MDGGGHGPSSGAGRAQRQVRVACRALCREEGGRLDIGIEEGQLGDETLKGYRESIDNIDAALVFLLAERFKVTQAVGRYKAQAGLPPADPGRESKQIERLRSLAETANLDPDFSEKFLRFIIDEVIRHHERVREA